MQREIKTLEKIATRIMDANSANTAYTHRTATDWAVGYALFRACIHNDQTYARRIESAFPELMNRFMPDVGEGES